MNLHPDILPPGALTPEHALRAWPHQLPLAALWSAPDPSPHSRWVILAIPTHSLIAHHPAHALQLLQQTFASPSTRPPAPVPFVGGWIALLAYDLAFALEPALTLRHYPADQRLPSHARDDRRWPLLVLQRCDTALLHDRREHRWWGLGPRAPELARSLADTRPHTPPPFHLQPAQPDPRARRRYLHAVELALELIHAGDLYQVNLAHRLTRRFRGCPRELFRRLIDTARPWYGGYIAFRHHGRHHALCSASPELLFALDPRSRLVTTRPMKGTRPGHTPPDELRASPKEHAELAMIVDLARNDLGRVCQPGSVRVHAPRDLERHDAGNVLQATATVTGRLRHDRSTLDLLHALFPAASVTGAPKIRAVQIIDRLETARRGPYCGALGFLSDCGSAAFNVAIRSAALSATPRPDGELRGRLDYAVGAGIVADSNPRDEWEETLVKARPFLHDLPAETPSV